jgi:iron(III) transport system permease protein
MMISGNFYLLPTEAYMQISGWFDLSTAAVLCTALLVPALCIFIINRKWVGKKSYVTITGKENSLIAISVVPWVKWLLFSACLLITLLILSIYGVLVYGAFTKAWGYDWSLTLQNMNYVFHKGREIYNSLVFAFASAVLATIFATLLSYIVQRKQVGLNRFLDFLAILPGAIPGVFLGLGFAMAFNQKPLELSGTAAIMILALAFWNLPTCYSASTGTLQQIGTSLEEASLNLGASSFKTLKNIIAPILKLPLISGLVISFLRSITCLSVVIFIYSAKTSVGTISILGLVQNGEWGSAAAFTVILISIAFSVLSLTQVLLKKYGKSIEF